MYSAPESKRYRGPVKAVIFDWAGTTVDFGSLAPTVVFVEEFKRRGVDITLEEARGPMGINKKDHLRAIINMPAVTGRWEAMHGRPPTEQDVDEMFEEFIPLQVECVARFADPIPGCVETVKALRERGIKIGSNTGYNRGMMDVLVPAAKERGYSPDCAVCSSDVSEGRPAPWIAYENARRLGVYPPAAMVKVDDTTPGIEEGLNAGMWTVGVAKTGNEMGMSLQELEALSANALEERLQTAYQNLARAGTHYVIDGIADLMACIDEIDQRLMRGETP